MLNLINSYINKRNEVLKKNKERDNYIFGLCFGFFVLLLNLYLFLSTPVLKIQNLIHIIFMFLGCIFILLATIYPNSLDLVHKIFKKVLSFIGSIIFKIILFVIYFIFVVPVGLIIKSKERKNLKIMDTNFVDYKTENNFENKKNGFYNIFQIFRIFNNERYALMLPLIIVLIIIGILLIFVQSSVVTPFIYTLF